jgi:small subunit ribosomal protein S27e
MPPLKRTVILVQRELIPKPQTNFLRVKCPKCGNEQVTFDRPSIPPHCTVCDELLAETTGGKAKLKAEVLQPLG